MPKKNLGGRPDKFTDEVIKKLEEAFAIDASVPEACYYADITPPTYYAHVRNDEKATKIQRKLFNRFARLRERPVLLARQTVVNNIQHDANLAMKYLERKRRDEFATRTEQTGADGAPVDNGSKELRDIADTLKKAVLDDGSSQGSEETR